MNESLRMVVVLAVIAMVSAAILTQVYEKTSIIIEDNAARALEDAVFEVLPNTVDVNIIRSSPNVLRPDDPKEMREREQRTTLIYQGLDERGEVTGYAFVGEGNGYGGTVRVLVGVDQVSQAILQIKILSHTETPGLGDRIEGESFRNQFVGRKLTDPIELNQDIDALSGATVSSRAVSEAVREGFHEAAAAYKGGE